MTVWFWFQGLESEYQEEGQLLGQFTYDQDGDSLQMFRVLVRPVELPWGPLRGQGPGGGLLPLRAVSVFCLALSRGPTKLSRWWSCGSCPTGATPSTRASTGSESTGIPPSEAWHCCVYFCIY